MSKATTSPQATGQLSRVVDLALVVLLLADMLFILLLNATNGFSWGTGLPLLCLAALATGPFLAHRADNERRRRLYRVLQRRAAIIFGGLAVLLIGIGFLGGSDATVDDRIAKLGSFQLAAFLGLAAISLWRCRPWHLLILGLLFARVEWPGVLALAPLWLVMAWAVVSSVEHGTERNDDSSNA